MEVYFLRHGSAEPASASVSDDVRELTDEGRRQVRALAEALCKGGTVIERVVSSPLTRARQTAEILAECFDVRAETDGRLRSGCRLGDAQAAILAQPYQRLMLVGHEPDFSVIVSQLVGGAHIKLRPGGVAGLHADRVEPGQATLLMLLSPQLFAAD